MLDKKGLPTVVRPSKLYKKTRESRFPLSVTRICNMTRKFIQPKTRTQKRFLYLGVGVLTTVLSLTAPVAAVRAGISARRRLVRSKCSDTTPVLHATAVVAHQRANTPAVDIRFTVYKTKKGAKRRFWMRFYDHENKNAFEMDHDTKVINVFQDPADTAHITFGKPNDVNSTLELEVDRKTLNKFKKLEKRNIIKFGELEDNTGLINMKLNAFDNPAQRRKTSEQPAFAYPRSRTCSVASVDSQSRQADPGQEPASTRKSSSSQPVPLSRGSVSRSGGPAPAEKSPKSWLVFASINNENHGEYTCHLANGELFMSNYNTNAQFALEGAKLQKNKQQACHVLILPNSDHVVLRRNKDNKAFHTNLREEFAEVNQLEWEDSEEKKKPF